MLIICVFISLLFSWLLRVIQTVLHMLQVTVGYMLMLCAMSYNVWIFLGIIMGSALGYFISFPFVGHMWLYEHFRKRMTFFLALFSHDEKVQGSHSLHTNFENYFIDFSAYYSVAPYLCGRGTNGEFCKRISCTTFVT